MTASVTVINSQDWKDSFTALNYVHLSGEDYFLLNSPGEAELLEIEDRIKLLESSSHPAVSGLEGRLENQGYRVKKQNLSWENSQYKFYDNVSGKVEGFIVVNNRAGAFTTTAFPKVVQDSYYLLQYDKNTLEFLKEKRKPVIFLGNFISEPWERLDVRTNKIKGNPLKANRKFISRFLRGKWIKITDSSSIDVKSLGDGTPILLKSDVSKVADLLQEENVKVVEVLGPENMLYAQQLREILDEEVKVVLKTARIFPGRTSGSRYGLKKIDFPDHSSDPVMEEVFYDPDSDTLGVKFSNKGELPARINFRSLELSGDNISRMRHPDNFILEGSTDVTYTFKTEILPEKVDIDAYSSGEKLVGEDGIGPQQVEKRPLSIFEDVEATGANFNSSSRTISVNIANKEEKSIWIQVFLETESGLMASRARKAEPGINSIRLKGHLEQREINKSFNFTVAKGKEKNSFTAMSSKKLEVEKLERNNDVILLAAISLLLAAVFFLSYIHHNIELPELVNSLKKNLLLPDSDEENNGSYR